MDAKHLSPKLTDQRLQVFAQAIVSGKSQSDAFRIMHPVSKRWKDKTIHTKASLWANNGEIQGKVAELRKQAAKRNETTVDLVDTMHKEAYMVAKNKKDANSMTRSARNLSDLHGLNKPEKFANTDKDGNDIINDNISINFINVKKKNKSDRQDN